jgi:hypothetical protein
MPLKPYQKQSALTRIEAKQEQLSETMERLATPRNHGKILVHETHGAGYIVAINPHQIAHIYASVNVRKRPTVTICMTSNGDQEEFDLNADFDAILAVYDAAMNGETIDLRDYTKASPKRLETWPIEPETEPEKHLETIYKRAGRVLR